MSDNVRGSRRVGVQFASSLSPCVAITPKSAMMRRRMAQMNARMNASANSNNHEAPQKPVHNAVTNQAGPPQQSQLQQQQAKPVIGGPNNHGGKPGTGAQPGPNVLKAVKEVQEEAQRQQQGFGKGNP